MSKAKSIMYVFIGVVMVYATLAVFAVFLSERTVSVNAEIAAAHNMSQYPGTSGFLLSVPWIMWFIPAVLGIILIVIIMKRGDIDG